MSVVRIICQFEERIKLYQQKLLELNTHHNLWNAKQAALNRWLSDENLGQLLPWLISAPCPIEHAPVFLESLSLDIHSLWHWAWLWIPRTITEARGKKEHEKTFCSPLNIHLNDLTLWLIEINIIQLMQMSCKLHSPPSHF